MYNDINIYIIGVWYKIKYMAKGEIAISYVSDLQLKKT